MRVGLAQCLGPIELEELILFAPSPAPARLPQKPRQSQGQPLVEQQDILHMLFRGHVDAQVAGDAGLIATDFALPGALALGLLLIQGGWDRGRRGGRGPHLGPAPNIGLVALEVGEVLVGLHVDAEVSLGGGGIIAGLATVRLVATVVALASGKPWVGATSTAIGAVAVALWVFLLHVNVQGLLILVMPVALGTLEGLARVARMEQ